MSILLDDVGEVVEAITVVVFVILAVAEAVK